MTTLKKSTSSSNNLPFNLHRGAPLPPNCKDTKVVIYNNSEVSLTESEFYLLFFFIDNPDKIFTRSFLLHEVFLYNPELKTSIIDTLILQIKEKLKGIKIIRTHGLSYILRP